MSNIIEVAQNRHYETEIVITDGDEYYTLEKTERLIFGVKKNPLDTDYILNKALTSDNRLENGYVLIFTSDEMNIPTGEYYYDVALIRNGTELYKIIEATKFRVLKSIVRSEV